jgi:hypothetical protein
VRVLITALVVAGVFLSVGSPARAQDAYSLTPGDVLTQADGSQVVVWQGQNWDGIYILPVAICAGPDGGRSDPRMFALVWPRMQVGEWIPGAVAPEIPSRQLHAYECVSGWIGFPQPGPFPGVSFHNQPCSLTAATCGQADAFWSQ